MVQYMPGIVNAHGQAILRGTFDRKMCVMSELLQDGQASVAGSDYLAKVVYRVLPAFSLCMALYRYAGLRCTAAS